MQHASTYVQMWVCMCKSVLVYRRKELYTSSHPADELWLYAECRNGDYFLSKLRVCSSHSISCAGWEGLQSPLLWASYPAVKALICLKAIMLMQLALTLLTSAIFFFFGWKTEGVLVIPAFSYQMTLSQGLGDLFTGTRPVKTKMNVHN